MQFEQQTPADWNALKQGIFQGKVYLLPPSAASQAIAKQLHTAFHNVNGYTFTNDVHTSKSFSTIMQDLNLARKTIIQPDFSVPLIHDLLSEFAGSADDDLIGDVLRLRAMPHNAHNEGLSPHSYSAHRDCWYANPQSQINIWIPLLDVSEGNSFQFYPKYFDQPIANTSDKFDYNHFTKSAGFQSSDKIDMSLYPIPTEDIDDPDAGSFAAQAGSRIIFSPSHLHQTALNETHKSRFSVDFRVVSRTDIAQNHGAPNSDNASRGAAQQDYHKIFTCHPTCHSSGHPTGHPPKPCPTPSKT